MPGLAFRSLAFKKKPVFCVCVSKPAKVQRFTCPDITFALSNCFGMNDYNGLRWPDSRESIRRFARLA